MLSVTNKPIMMSVIILNVVLLSFPNKPYMLSVVMLNVVAPHFNCALFLQLNDTMTVFMGGSADNYRIVTYDWSTQTYTANTAKV